MCLNLNSVKILGMEYSVSIIKNLKDDGTRVLGVTDFLNRTIKIEKEQDDENIKQTLLHEIIHIVLWDAGYDDEEQSERFVIYVSNILYQIFKDNKLPF